MQIGERFQTSHFLSISQLVDENMASDVTYNFREIKDLFSFILIPISVERHRAICPLDPYEKDTLLCGEPASSFLQETHLVQSPVCCF